jgi:hypothetical protein
MVAQSDDAPSSGNRATYQRALEDIGKMPVAAADPYAAIVGRFAQLAPHTRLFLQALSREDVETLVRVIRHHQFAVRLFHFSRRTVVWAIGAIVAGAIAGESVLKFAERVVGHLW